MDLKRENTGKDKDYLLHVHLITVEVALYGDVTDRFRRKA